MTKFLKGRPGLRDTQVRNTNTPLSCLQEVQEAAKEETQHHREGGGKENPPARLVSKISGGGKESQPAWSQNSPVTLAATLGGRTAMIAWVMRKT